MTCNNIKIEMLSTGDEVLYGQIVDTNAAWLSEFLFQEGFLITSRFTTGDNLQQLIATLQERSLVNDILIVNGGLGPTSDDLCAQAAALANNEILVLNQQWLLEMERYFSSRGLTMPASNQKQAMLPQSATVINNPIGTACGFKMQLNDCMLFFTPGVPSEFKEMIRTSIMSEIKLRFPKVEKSLCYRLTTMGRTESDLATEIEAKLDIPEDIVIGYRAAMPIIELKLTAPQHKKNAMDKLWLELRELVKDNLLYEGGITYHNENGLAKVVSGLLNEKNLTMTVIEQQSAGMISYQLFECDAPVVKSEVVPLLTTEPKDYLLNALTKTKADIALGLVNFKEKNSQFMLIIATMKQVLEFNLKYIGRKQNRQTEQRILATIALDALRRYLLDRSIIGPNVWLEVLE
ncbi:CinA family nicotinamide mononucleotide deamidase-related protein [Gilliamella sp. wkB112]|uniref:CinA family nicotinamide mononucleotide deamidase-related protein n=1 Tax=Gilliamella sp. wkB112 TaxID=3120257 RepID=UPI00080E18BF|nr:CinA family nicotinamide mononucleotide deamidase-related protein [Gilliamella apicola]OCG03167.1 hypothetical protein A9G12_09660 [Gilliamella apicola]